MLAENEALIAEFYLRQGKTGSSTARYEGLIANYADTDAGREKAHLLREKIINVGAVDERSLPQLAAPARFDGDPVAPVIVSAVADKSARKTFNHNSSAASPIANSRQNQPAASSDVASKNAAAQSSAVSVVEGNLLAGNDGDASPGETANFVSSLKCGALPDGVQLITVLLNDEPEVIGERTESSNLILKFRRRGNSSTKTNGDLSAKIQSCHVGELAAEISGDTDEITLKTSGKAIADYTQLVLDRPYRLAVIVR